MERESQFLSSVARGPEIDSHRQREKETEANRQREADRHRLIFIKIERQITKQNTDAIGLC